MDAARQAVAGVKASIGYAPQGAERAYVGTPGMRGGGMLWTHVLRVDWRKGVARIDKDHRMTTGRLKLTEIYTRETLALLYIRAHRAIIISGHEKRRGLDSSPPPPGGGRVGGPRRTVLSAATAAPQRPLGSRAHASLTKIAAVAAAVAAGDTDALSATHVREALSHRSSAPERRYLLPQVKVSAGCRRW